MVAAITLLTSRVCAAPSSTSWPARLDLQETSKQGPEVPSIDPGGGMVTPFVGYTVHA